MTARLLSLASLVALGLAPPHRAEGQSVADRWKARALQAADALARLESEMKALRARGGKRDSDEMRALQLRSTLERAFADHLDAKRQKELHRTLPGGDEIFALVLRVKRRSSLSLHYLYDGSGAPLGVRLLALPENWSVVLPGKSPAAERKLFVDPGEHGKAPPPLLVFDLDDAFGATVKDGS